ncbi:MAG: DUF2357 domain-containing protein, partial [Chloroflexota bacterium]|nr:DUF2357 domain-containing protein [Chloroflexota bacterium]
MDISDIGSSHEAPDEAFPISCDRAGDVIAVPAGLETVLAPARWCVYEWTEYRLTFEDADRLKVGSSWIAPMFPGRFVFQFENQLGLTSITPYAGSYPLTSPIHLEVLARKFAHPRQSVDFMMALLSDIFARQSSLPFETVATTERRVRESHRPPNLLFTYHFFRRHAADLIRALQAVLGRPHQRLTDDGVMVRLHEVRKLEHESIMRLLTSGRGAGGVNQVSSNAPVIQRLRPERVFQRLPDETYDTPENRFVVMAARRMALALDHLLRSVWFGKIGVEGRDRLPFDRASEHLKMLTTDTRFSTLPHMQAYPAQSRVLQRRDGYRELAQLWNTFQRASQPIFEHLQYAIDLRNVADLYELWVWFELIDRVEAHTGMEPVISASKDVFGAPVHGQHARFGLHGTLYYNQTYRKGKHVYSAINLRPDYVWERADGRLIVMDAKFRLDNLSDLIASGDDDVLAISAKAKDADLQKMHTYRDAIAGVTAAVVLYPGSQSGF